MRKVIIPVYIVAMVLVACCGLVSCKNEQKTGSGPVAAPLPTVPLPTKREQLLKTEFRAIYITSWTARISRFNALLEEIRKREMAKAGLVTVLPPSGKICRQSACRPVNNKEL